jgi:acrylyl-CoA reductase (NADPH)
MTSETFRALVVDQNEGATTAEIRQLTASDLPIGDVTVAVRYSSLNYKDGLAVTGTARVLRSFPMVPGIDLAGEVQASESDAYRPGDRVVLTGWGIGERHWGGYTQLNRVRSEWLVPLPGGLDLKQSMAIGTAGFTAMLCVLALEDAGLAPGEREVLVTGAAGGVGSVAVALLAAAGYRVAASTGRPEAHEYLRALGASSIVPREELSAPGRPLEGERWLGAIDTVGGDTLAGVLRSTAYWGAVAACGNAGGAQLNTTVFPFILRGVRLLGVESVLCPPQRRQAAWERLARDLQPAILDELTQVVSLARIPELSRQIIAGQVRGRVVVDLGAA